MFAPDANVELPVCVVGREKGIVVVSWRGFSQNHRADHDTKLTPPPHSPTRQEDVETALDSLAKQKVKGVWMWVGVAKRCDATPPLPPSLIPTTRASPPSC